MKATPMLLTSVLLCHLIKADPIAKSSGKYLSVYYFYLIVKEILSLPRYLFVKQSCSLVQYFSGIRCMETWPSGNDWERDCSERGDANFCSKKHQYWRDNNIATNVTSRWCATKGVMDEFKKYNLTSVGCVTVSLSWPSIDFYEVTACLCEGNLCNAD